MASRKPKKVIVNDTTGAIFNKNKKKKRRFKVKGGTSTQQVIAILSKMSQEGKGSK